MTSDDVRDTAQPNSRAGPTVVELARYAAAIAAADDPDSLMDAATAAFREMAAFSTTGDHLAVAGAAIVVGDACLRLCASRSTSARDAENRARFLAIIVGWAWVREPALAIVLDAYRRIEHEAWGDDFGSAWTG